MDHSGVVTLDTTTGSFQGRIVVDAAGMNSPFFKEYKKVSSPKIMSLVLEDDLSNETQDDFFGNDDGNLYYKTYVFSGTVGYGWAFGKDGKINVGLGGVMLGRGRRGTKTVDRTHRTGGKFYARLFDEMLDSFPFDLDRSRKKAFLLPTEVIYRLYDHRLLFVGDAGGFVDPLTGGGIEVGIKTARDAAAACKLAVERNDFSASTLSVYEQLAEQEIRMLRRKTLALKFAIKAMGSPWTTPGAIKFCLKHFSRFADTSKRKG